MNIFNKIFNQIVGETSTVVEKSTSIELVKPKPKQKYSDDIMRIHNEFSNSAQEALEAAIEFVKQNDKCRLKPERLGKVGFRNVPEVTEASKIIEKLNISKVQIELINKYRVKYPQYKFITEEQVKNICSKYNLVCGGIDRYKGFVPDTNLTDIEKFLNKYIFNMWITDRTNKIVDMSDYEIRGRGSYEHFYHKRTGERVFQRDTSDTDYYFYASGTINGEKLDCTSKDGRLRPLQLQICAPLKDMNTTGLKLEGYKLKREIPDPVVLQPIKGGYLIVTAWGDEASDENVVNENYQ